MNHPYRYAIDTLSTWGVFFVKKVITTEMAGKKKKVEFAWFVWVTVGCVLARVKIDPKACNSWVIEPTPLKNMLVKMGSSSPIFGVNMKNI